MAKDGKGFLDPSVAELLGAGERRSEERALPRAERSKAKKRRAQQAERNGRRAVYDLSPELIGQVSELAREQGTTASMVAGILIPYALQAIERGDLDLGEYRRLLVRNPRYEAELVWKKRNHE